MLLIFILMLYFGNQTVQLLSVPFLFLALMVDSIDGIVARRTGKVSLTGSVLDIVADRVYELVLWVSFSDLGVIPVVIPLIVITRTTWTDAIRSIGVRKGEAPFDQHSSKLGRFIVGSPWMRSSYGIAKIVSFCGLALGIALAGFPEGTRALQSSSTILAIFNVTSWIAVILCVIRGAPIIAGVLQRSQITRDEIQRERHDR
jgi:phosphatidylglycerophosphate synthase